MEIPEFKTEQEEAEWWASHQNETLAMFKQAAKDGTLRRGTLAKRKEGSNE